MFLHLGSTNEFKLRCFDCGVTTDSDISRDVCVSRWNTLAASKKSAYVTKALIEIQINDDDLIRALDGKRCFEDGYRLAKGLEESLVSEVLELFDRKIKEACNDSDGSSKAVGIHHKNGAAAPKERAERG